MDETQIPTGEIKDVGADDAAFDFRVAGGKVLGDAIDAIDGSGKPGIDHSFVKEECTNGSSSSTCSQIAILRDPVSGRMLEVHTTQVFKAHCIIISLIRLL